ncbi:MAG TPA: hypothetical protein VH396_14030 [Chitinophagaceae bacterium]|jgi:hypothetical protein
MKTQLLIPRLLVIALTATSFVSCKKDDTYCNIKRPFKAKIDTWYRVSPTDPQIVVVNGTTYIGFANFPGGGTGNVTHMGQCSNYFNQLVYASAPDAPPAGSIAAPVIDAINYPVTGAPLPLIQAGDFTAFANANDDLHIPIKVHGAIVNSVFYDDKGNAIFTSAITGSGGTFPISKTLVGFNGKGIIVGGRGKFEHAAGRFDYEGYFNTADANDAEYKADGWIAY